jgi:hypothetical protein
VRIHAGIKIVNTMVSIQLSFVPVGIGRRRIVWIGYHDYGTETIGWEGQTRLLERNYEVLVDPTRDIQEVR